MVNVPKDVAAVVTVNVEIGALVVPNVFIAKSHGGAKEIIKVTIVIEVEEHPINNAKLPPDVNLAKEATA